MHIRKHLNAKAKQGLRFVWARRHALSYRLRWVMGRLLNLYRRIPIPQRARFVIKDLVFTSLQYFIFQTSLYQSWAAQKTGNLQLSQWINHDQPDARLAKAPLPKAPSESQWRELTPPAQNAPTVDIVLPVYKGYDDTLACIYSVLTNKLETPYELIVINDASPDAALAEKLRELAARGLFTLLENEKNLGFVQSVNRGMKLHDSRDVLLLNSDTEVYNNWLDRLRAAAYRDKKTATVTPFSNNAEICSYPFFLRDNDMALEVDFAGLDDIAAQANAGRSVAIPTAVGFCMFIKREALGEVGYFDAEAFGRGYGEENDFCLRAGELGWHHLLAGDVFVRHFGGSSFGSEKSARIEAALRIINKRYPYYAGSIAEFIARDPARELRRNMALGRLSRLKKSRSFLFVSHNIGGGTERHVQDMVQQLEREGVSVYMLRPSSVNPAALTLSHPGAFPTPNLDYDLHTQSEALSKGLEALGISHIHVHHLIGFDRSVMDYLALITKRLGISYDFTVHDYFPICPRINLIDASGRYCGEPEISVCEGCVRKSGSAAGIVPVWQWRHHYAQFLEGAAHVFVPDADVAQRLARYFPKLAITVRPHPEQAVVASIPFRAQLPGGSRRVAILGAIGPHKGSEIILACARDAALRKLPLEFVIIGTANNAHQLHPYRNVTLTGAYEEHEVFSLIEKQECHLAFFSSVWPETYCYTLSIAFQANLFPVSFDLGAPARRIREAKWGEVLPLSMMQSAHAINDALLALEIAAPPARISLPKMEELYPNLVKQYYKQAA